MVSHALDIPFLNTQEITLPATCGGPPNQGRTRHTPSPLRAYHAHQVMCPEHTLINTLTGSIRQRRMLCSVLYHPAASVVYGLHLVPGSSRWAITCG